jgi:hypothetical protein
MKRAEAKSEAEAAGATVTGSVRYCEQPTCAHESHK